MSDIVKLPPKFKGNGAREALQKWFDETTADQLLILLWIEGFKVVPLDATDYAKIEHDHRKYRR